LNALINEDYRQIKPKPKTIPLQPKSKGEKVDRQTARTRGLNVKVPRPPKKKAVSTVPEKEKPPVKSRIYAQVDPVKKPQRTTRPNDYGRSKENLNTQKPRRQINQKVSSENSQSSTKNDQVITLTQDQLTKLLGMVANSTDTNSITVHPNQPAVQPSIAIPTAPQIETPSVSVPEDMEPVNALNMLQNKNLENGIPLANSTLNEIPKEQIRKLSRDEQLAESQKNIPLQMRSSFLPYEAVPRDILAEQRKQKQMEWRRELEKQRRDDEERKKTQKDKEKKEMLIDHHLFQSVTDFSQLEEPERPTDIPRLDLVRELSTVSARPDPKSTVLPSTESSADYNFHRRLNTLKDPEELRRLDEARQARLKHEQMIRDQIEENKRLEAKKRSDDEEPWWVKQDRKKQIAIETERKQVVQQPVQVPIVPKIDVSQPDEKFPTYDEGYRDTTSSRQPQINSQVRIVLREIETQTDFAPIASKSPPKSTREVLKPSVSTTSVSAKSVSSAEYKTNLELRALERDEKRKRRQIELLEEQQRQEERLIQLRASKSKTKQAPSSREKSKTDKKPEKSITADISKENVSSENNSNEAVLNQLQQLRSRLQQKHDAFKKK